MSGSLPVDTSAVTSSEINNTQLPPKILPLPNQQQPLATHFTASFGNMLPGSNIPPVAPAVSSSGLPSYYEQQLSALQNPASNQNTGAGTSMFGYNQQEVPPGVEVPRASPNMNGQSLFYVDRSGQNFPGAAPSSVGAQFNAPGQFRPPRQMRGPRPAHSMPTRPVGNADDKSQLGGTAGRYSPSNPTSSTGFSSQPSRPQHQQFSRRDGGRAFNRGPAPSGPQMSGPRPPNNFRPNSAGQNNSSQSRPNIGKPNAPVQARPNPTPPPPGATFEFHPHHWVIFSGPQSVISTMPPSSRLFMGNLATERTDLKELARMFAPYGNILEIVLKGSYGFVQFDNPEACRRAMENEAGRKVAGLSIDLKISRAKRKDNERRGDNFRRDSQDRGDRNRRRDSHDEWRGDRDRRRRDRSSSRSSWDSEDDYRRRRDENRRDRRSASPKRQGRGSKWGPEAQKSMNIDGNAQQMTLENTNFPTPTINNAPVGSGLLPLPVRVGTNVPECQIIVIGDMDRSYVTQVEQTIHNAGVVVNTLHLTPKMALRDVVHQMMAEGVRGVVFLERRHVAPKTVSMQVFQAGGTVAEYDNLKADMAALLIIRDRSVRPIVQPQFGGVGQQQALGGGNAFGGVLANFLGGQTAQSTGGLDAQTLLTLVGALHQQQQQQQPQLGALMQLAQGLGGQGMGQANPLAALGLGGLAGIPAQQQQTAPQPQTQASGQQQPNLAAMLSMLSAQQQPQQQGQNALLAQQLQQLQQRPQQPATLPTPVQTSGQTMGQTGFALPTATQVQPTFGNMRMSTTPQTATTQGTTATAATSGTTESVADLLNRLKSLQQLHPSGQQAQK